MSYKRVAVVDPTKVVNIRDYGGRPNGTTGTRAAVVAAVAAGATTIEFDEGSSSYYWEAPYAPPSGLTLKAGRGRPTFTFDPAAATSRQFTMSAKDHITFKGIKFDGTTIPVRNDAFIVLSGGCTYNVFDDCEFESCPAATVGCVVFSGATTKHNNMRWCKFNNTYAEAIGFTAATYNTIFMCTLLNTGGFGVRIGELASYNRVVGLTSLISTREGIGIYHDCLENHIEACRIEEAADNGISVSGRRNTVIGCHLYNNYAAGIGIWGEDNSIIGNICLNNGSSNRYEFWSSSLSVTAGQYYFNSSTFVLYQAASSGTTANLPVHLSGTVALGDGISWTYIGAKVRWSGVWVSVGYGGTGQRNYIAGNQVDDTLTTMGQWYGVLIEGGGGYATWANGQTILAGDPTYSYRVYNLNIYFSSNGGTTATGSEPVHTTGIVTGADGISWEWRNAFVSSAAPRSNVVTGNPWTRSKAGRAAYDQALWVANTLVSHGEHHLNVTNGLTMTNLPTYATDALASAGGLALESIYLDTTGALRSRKDYAAGQRNPMTTRVVTAAGAITVLALDELVVVRKTSGAATAVTLPSSPVTGRIYIIKDGKGDAATNNITISPASGTIDASANVVLATAYGSLDFVYDGTQWSII